MIKRIISFFFFFIISYLYSQDVYSEVRKKYWSFEENDQRAFIYLNKNIVKAKSEQNHQELFQAYKDAILFSKDKKIEYADSAIVAAKQTGNSDFIGDSYLSKGAIYYFNYREFQFALNEYLKAYEYLKDSKNGFLKYQNLYHIGVIKSYLGYYKEALQIFKECIIFFESQTKFDLHENLIYNNTKGYLNSLHQAIICYQALGKFDQADQLLKKAEQSTPKNKDFNLENSYFKKSIGISEFSKGNYTQAIKEFDLALPSLIKVNDFTWASYVYFYKGKSYTKTGNPDLGVRNYKKVDSIFNKYKFILPELRNNYEELITYYKKKNDAENQLYYTNQLLKVDSVISSDFKYLSTRIHRDYDTKSLLEVKEDLEKTNSFGKILLIICIVIILLLGALVYYRSRKQKQIQQKYSQLLIKMEEAKVTENIEISLKYDVSKNVKLDKTIVEKLLNDINNFEMNKGYLEKGITLKKLSDQFKTNTSYLSQVINEYKGNNFNTYINILRINYATQKIYDDREWRKYSIEHIASASGFSNRQSFSNVFLEQNGIRPVDFIKNRIKETEVT
ncbi:helix-turn-helix domain-containing protein [Chryseobacterium chendengshani]|uniref:helix-turn-helix domain-containing protein n=1 Tax=Chryseobacterium sp. LJ668 TaxID=2864040 RepID=UPI001C68C228|nr:AraC family transcriptional regulator [Chryseobacterium sp. LJ668]MBW8522869.1 helix-turn-helix domain-containing protein [Chryseobacterium sp. LJ668]QYK16399.1 helix-turn-helix domain-containing protein [Chryseobacterium sp. LJ668]